MQGKRLQGRETWLPALVAVLGILVSTALYWRLESNQRDARTEAAAAKLDTAIRIVESALTERIQGLRRMALRWERQGERSRAEFDLEADVLRQSFPSFRALGWVGPDLRVRWVYPEAENRAALGLAVNAEPVRAGAFARARRDGTAITPPVDLVQGGRGVLGIVPILRTGAGYVYAAIDLEILFRKELTDAVGDYAFVVSAAGEPAILVGDPGDGPQLSEAVMLGGIPWRIDVVAAPPQAPAPLIVLGFGTLLSISLAAAIRGRMRAGASTQAARRAAEALSHSEERYRAIIETAVDAVIVTDARGTIRSLNPAAATLFAYAPDELIGRNVSILMPAAHAREHDGHLRRYAATGERRIIGIGRELQGRRKDGSQFPFEVSIGEWSAGGETFFTALIRDISARKDAEAMLRARTAALEELASTLDLAPVLIRGMDDRIRYWNAGTTTLYGWSPREAVGRISHDLLGTEFPDGAAPVHAELFRAGVWRGELVQRRRDGTPIHCECLWVVHRAPDGSPQSIIEVNTDITARKAAEAEIQALNRSLEQRVDMRTRQLQDANAELEAFAHSVAHDLRAPLRSMRGFSQALAEDYARHLDETAGDYLDRISGSAERMDMLIQDLLGYARVSREELVLTAVGLDQIVTDALRQVEGTVREVDADIQVDSPLPVVLGHRGVLVQVLANLLSNALKFTSRDRRPVIRVRGENGPRVRLWVEDNGIGIAPDHQDRIFQVFQRLHGMAEYPGTGIGLAIVRRGVERMGGSAGVESVPGEGSRFWIELNGA